MIEMIPMTLMIKIMKRTIMTMPMMMTMTSLSRDKATQGLGNEYKVIQRVDEYDDDEDQNMNKMITL